MDQLNKFILILLAPLGVVYRFIIWVRNLFYDIGVFPSKKLPCKVISIGNIDICPCAGTHVRSLKEIGIVEFVKKDNKGSGKQRISYSLK